MASKDTTARFNVDISGLKKNIQEANRQIKLANAEFKAASAGMESWAKSTDGLTAKIEQTQKVLTAQKTILAEYEKQLELVEKEYGKNSKEADAMRIKVLNQEAAVKTTAAQLDKYEKELVEVEKAEKEAGKATEEQLSAYEKLEKSIKDQEKQLGDLKKEYASVVLEQGKNSKAAQELAKEIDTLSNELEQDKEAFKDAAYEADNLDDELEDTAKGAKEAGDAADKAGDGFSVMKGVLADLAATAIKAVVEGLKDLASAAADAWKEFDEGADAIIKTTGATGAAADELIASYNNVAHEVIGDFGDIGSVIGAVNTRFGVTGDALENMSEDFLKFADITGGDAVSAVQDVSRALEGAGLDASEYNKVLDMVAKASQDTGVGSDKMLEGLTKYGAGMRQLGFDTSDTIAMFAQWEKEGVNIEVAFGGMQKAVQNWSKAGKDGTKEFSKTIDAIKKAKTDTEATQMALEVFGKKAGVELADAIRSGRFEFDSYAKALEAAGGTVERTYEETLDIPDKFALMQQGLRADLAMTADAFMEQYAPAIEDAMNKVGGILSDSIPLLADFIAGVDGAGEQLGANLSQLISMALDALVKALPQIVELATGLIDTLTTALLDMLPELVDVAADIIVQLIDALAKLLPKITEKIIEIVPKIIDALIGAIPDLIQASVDFFTAIVDALPEIISQLQTALPQIIDTIISGINKGLPMWIEAVVQLWTALIDAIPQIIPLLTETLPQLLDAIIGGIADWLPMLIDGAVELIMAIANSIDEIIEPLIKALPDVVNAIVKALLTALPVLLKGAIKLFMALVDALPTIILELAKALPDLVASVVEILLENAPLLLAGALEFFGAIIAAIPQILVQLASELPKIVQTVLNVLVTPIVGLLEGIRNTITDVFGGAFDWVVETVIDPIVESFTTFADSLIEFATTAWDGICAVFEGAVDWFTDIFEGVSDAIKTIMEGVVNIVKKPINTIIGYLNKFIDGINEVQVPDWVPVVGGKGINIPHIKELEQGGVLPKGKTGFLEGNGAEAVVPLERNKKWIAAVSADLRKSLANEGVVSGAGSTTTTYNFVQNNNSPKALNRLEIYRQTKNQLAFANGGGIVNA